MIDARDDLSPEVRSLLYREREIDPVPALTRARIMARARAAVTAGPAVYYRPRSRPAPVRWAGGGGGHGVAGAHTPVRWAAAAAITFVAAAAVGAGAYEVRVRLEHHGAAPVRVVAALATSAPEAPVAIAPMGETEVATPSHVAGAARLSRADAAREELRLLRLARAAVARQDFAAALPPITEHARRFKDGRFAEEREALRVRALAGLGRTDEAGRAARRFQIRFPRSVLLPAVRQMPTARP
jgi:hypothetical protein